MGHTPRSGKVRPCCVNVITPVADLVRSCGFDVHQPVSLRSTNNLVVWLSPSPVVAKISKEHDRAGRELAVVSELVELAAPVVPPVELGIEQPVSIDETAFPSFRETLMSTVSALERPDFAPELVEVDRALLRQTLVDGTARLAQMTSGERVIHGSPHRFNILIVDAAPMFIDFETVELGPLEWDLAHLEPEVADLYPGEFDYRALALCRVMVSAATSAWCWEGLERGSDMQIHAQHHLEVVRSSRT
jgi:hypothetical protein